MCLSGQTPFAKLCLISGLETARLWPRRLQGRGCVQMAVRAPAASPRSRRNGSGGRSSSSPSSPPLATVSGRSHGSPLTPSSPAGSGGARTPTPRGRPLRPSRTAGSTAEKVPLRASASVLQGGKQSPTSSAGRSPSSSARAAALEAEVAALRLQLSEQAEGHQSDMSALRAEQALRRAALEDALRAEADESERRLCLPHFPGKTKTGSRS